MVDIEKLKQKPVYNKRVLGVWLDNSLLDTFDVWCKKNEIRKSHVVGALIEDLLTEQGALPDGDNPASS